MAAKYLVLLRHGAFCRLEAKHKSNIFLHLCYSSDMFEECYKKTPRCYQPFHYPRTTNFFDYAELGIVNSVFFVMQLETKKDGTAVSCIAKKTF
ncbi:MAG TPA: hypothetical protein DCO75_08160 [Fibrobacteres bacterium]|nr:hypothetical protein [Fibrobacterota bacterium]